MKFHDTLNDKIWDIENDNQILPEVKDKLEEIASAFIEYLEIPQDAILDKVITGSSASYNYNNFSDLDLHIIVDYDKIHEDCPLVEGYLGALKNTFNKEHDIYIHGIPVELYAEKKDQGTVHNGLYSLNSGWVDFPEKIAPTDNDAAVEAKFNEIKEMVDRCDDSESATELLEKIYTMRKAGLASSGEFCTENLAFKKLRNGGCMDKLREIKKKDIDKQLSLESYNEALQVGEAEILEWLKQRQVKVGYGFNKLSKEGTAYYMAKLINSLDENIINKIKEADFSNFNTKEFTLENKEALEAPKVVPCNSIITRLVCLYINPETNKTYNEKPTEEETLRRSIKIKMNKLYNKKTGWDRKGYYFLQKNGNKYEIVTNLGKGQHEVVITADSLQELNDILAEKLNNGQNNIKNESINKEIKESSIIDNFKEMVNKIAKDFKAEGYPKSKKFLLDFVDEAIKEFETSNDNKIKVSTDNGTAVLTLDDMYQGRINSQTGKVRFTDLENSNYAYESLKEGLDKMVNKAMNESVMDTDIELIDSWLTKLGFEDAQGPQGYVFMRKTGDKLERIIIDNNKLTYTKGEEKKEFPFSNTVEIQKAFKALNEGKEMNEDLKTIWKNEMKRDLIIDTPDGPIYLQPSEDGKSIEFGTMTNNGMIVDGSVEYDFDYSLDTNLDTVYDEIRDYYELYLVPEEDRDQVVTDEKEDRLSDLFPESKNEDIATLTDKVDQAHNDLKDLIKSLSNKIEEALTEPVEIGTRVGTPDGQVTGTVKEVNTVTKEVKIETDEVPGKPKEEKTFKIDQLDNIIKEALQ